VSRGPAAAWLWRELEGAVLLKYWREEFFKKKKKNHGGQRGQQQTEVQRWLDRLVTPVCEKGIAKRLYGLIMAAAGSMFI
jgi:hypothetical protein